MTNTITIYRGPDVWMAQHSDPSIRELFNGADLPTPYHSATPAATVLVELGRRNPGSAVVVRT